MSCLSGAGRPDERKHRAAREIATDRQRPDRRRRCCWPGTTGIGAGCRGGRCRARRPIPIGCGCRKSCCSRPASKRSGRISRNSWRAGRRGRAGPRLARRCAADVGRARLLFARAQSACLRGRGVARSWRRVSGHRGRLARAAGDRPLHRGRDRCDRVRPPTMPVDGNIERVVSRLFAVEEPLPQAKPLIQHLAATCSRRHKSRAGDVKSRAGDSAQALMDLGSSICTPKKPACALCPLNEDCVARARGDQETFPRKPAEENRRVAPRCGLRRHARRRTAGAHAGPKKACSAA